MYNILLKFHANMRSLKEHISSKFEAGFPFSQICTKKIVIFFSSEIFLLLRIALAKPSFLSEVHQFFYFEKGNTICESITG